MTMCATRLNKTTHPAVKGKVSSPEAPGSQEVFENDEHLALRVCLRLLSCATHMENEIRRYLRAQAGISLARFDYLAQLDRHQDGLTMSAISRSLMVTGGNVTGLTNELEAEGMVRRTVDSEDRRSYRVRLTSKGKRAFTKIAAEHEAWVIDRMAMLGHEKQVSLHQLLGDLRQQLSGTSLKENTDRARAGEAD